MWNLLRFLIRSYPIILFLILEILSFVLIGKFNSYQSAKIYNVKHIILGRIERKFDNLSSYLTLAKENKALAEENIKLYNALPPGYFNPSKRFVPDTSANKKYVFLGARVINNSTNKQYNFLVLNKGKKQGIEPEMAVICNQGIVGIVKECSDNFSSVISVLNREFFPNAMIKRNRYFGYIEWLGRRYNRVILKEIPLHVDVHIGDTIVTSGHSAVFPEGIMIGTVESFKPEEGIFYVITVKLSTDFKNLTNVILIKNNMREEQVKVEKDLEND
jgi:rod shape-determining protein MreC